MLTLSKCVGEPAGHRDVTRLAAFRLPCLPLPDRSLHSQLALLETDICPFQRCDFTSPQSGVTAEQGRQMRFVASDRRRRQQSLILIEVMERCFLRMILEQPN